MYVMGPSFKYGLYVVGLSIWAKVERIELRVRNMSKKKSSFFLDQIISIALQGM